MILKSGWLQFTHEGWRMWKVLRWMRRTRDKEDPPRRRSRIHLCPPEAAQGQREVSPRKISLSRVLICTDVLWFKHFPVLVSGQAKPSVSSRGDESFVTPRKTRKAKKPVITFSSDEEEEDEEGEFSHFIHSTQVYLFFWLSLTNHFNY